MPTHYSTRFAIALLTAFTPACGDSLAPGTLGQAYRLDQVANDRLPTVLYSNEYGTVYVISQTMRFGPKGTGSLQQTSELVPHLPDQPREGPVETSMGIGWIEVNGRVQIEFDCPFNANCAAGPHLTAQVGAHTLRATWGQELTGRSPLVYTEVPSPQ